MNRKPCCGEVRVGKTTLHPREETEVEVTLSVNREFGNIVHETALSTEPPQTEDLVLRTTAKACPPIQIEDVTPAEGLVLVSSNQPKQVEFRVFANGSATEPPLDLDRIELRSTIKADWVGAKEVGPSEEGLTVESRRMAALLDPFGPPGNRTSEILLLDGKDVVHRHVVSWESTSLITADPKMIVMKPGKIGYLVVVRSRDRRLFRITRIESDWAGVRGRAVNAAPASAQGLEIDASGVARSESKRGVITAFTDHPAQQRVDVPLRVLD